jgi:hypothetical protein
MSPSSVSHLKTTVVAALAGAVVIAFTLIAAQRLEGVAKILVEGIGSLIALAIACVALGGVVVLYRSRGLARGRPDLFLRLNADRDLKVVSSGECGWGIRVRRFFRRAFGGAYLLVGDMVQVRSLQEIEDTLDESGCLDGLPFMKEMAAFCDQRFRVFRCVDKIFDYGRSARLRRIGNVVLLAALRCDGHAHGGCQASCFLLWKTAWLNRVRDEVEPANATLRGPAEKPAVSAEPPTASCYTCQFTQLTAASRPMSRWDIRQDLRPLLTGNLTFGAFCVGVLTRAFNRVERLRGGSGYPPMSRGTLKKTPLLTHGLAPGDSVRVLGGDRIAATLDTGSRNRGLWFDQEMIKHCSQRHRVSTRIERIIDISTGRILEMKNPCIVLEGVDSSGEFLRFWAQHEMLYWREGWLEPERSDPEAAARNSSVERARPPPS